MRIGGGANSTLSIPRDTVVDIPGHGPDKINAAYALGGPSLAIRTVEQYLGLEVNHLVEVNFENFPQLIDALGGITYRGGCVVSRINGGFKNGGYTLRLKAGEQEIDGKQALALARTRTNECNKRENDLTRARRQQKIMGSIKDKVTSFETFVRLPWVAWAAPKAIRSDMSGPSLLGLVGAELTAGTAKPTVLRPTGTRHAARRRRGPDGRRRRQAARGRPLPARVMEYALGAVVAAVVLALAYGPSYLGYDAAWALVWGAELAGGAAAELRDGVRADAASAGEPGRGAAVAARRWRRDFARVADVLGVRRARRGRLGAGRGDRRGGGRRRRGAARRHAQRPGPRGRVRLGRPAVPGARGLGGRRRGAARAGQRAAARAARAGGLLRPEAWGLAAAASARGRRSRAATRRSGGSRRSRSRRRCCGC